MIIKNYIMYDNFINL